MKQLYIALKLLLLATSLSAANFDVLNYIKNRSAKVQTIHEGQPGISQGSGVVLEGGRILTNHHVIDGASEIRVIKYGEKSFVTATVISSDSVKDVALLKIDNKNWKYFVADVNYSLDETLYIVGNPIFEDFSIATTKISAITMVPHLKTKPIMQISNLPDKDQIEAIISSVDFYYMPMLLYPCHGATFGYSGGGVFNKQGKLIAISELLFPAFQENEQDYCGAIPIQEVNLQEK